MSNCVWFNFFQELTLVIKTIKKYDSSIVLFDAFNKIYIFIYLYKLISFVNMVKFCYNSFPIFYIFVIHRNVPTRFNETGLMARKRITNNKLAVVILKLKCDSNDHAFCEVKFQRGLCYNGQTQHLASFLQWKHRKELDTSCQYQFPNHHLGKLIGWIDPCAKEKDT